MLLCKNICKVRNLIEMKNIVYGIILVLLVSLSTECLSAKGLPFTLGIRAGVNLSEQSINYDELFEGVCESSMSSKAGFQIGAVINMRLSERVALQPGILWKTHAYDYFNASIMNDGSYMKLSSGEARYHTIQIPMLVSYRIDVSVLEWQVDLGPYVAFGVGGNNKLETNEMSLTDVRQSVKSFRYNTDFYGDSDGNIIGNRNFDWGFKVGTGFNIRDKFYVGAHYNLGLRKLGKPHAKFLKKPSVWNRCLEFSLGYNF